MSEITVTIKYGKGYDESWVVFRAETTQLLRPQIINYFDIDRTYADGLTTNELVIAATKQAHGVGLAVQSLGGTIVPQKHGGFDGRSALKRPQFDEAQAAGGDPWAEAEQGEQAEDPLQFYKDGIANAQSVDEIKQFWAENRKAFDDNPSLLDLYKTRGKALSAQAN